jgi:hypothetical protein
MKCHFSDAGSCSFGGVEVQKICNSTVDLLISSEARRPTVGPCDRQIQVQNGVLPAPVHSFTCHCQEKSKSHKVYVQFADGRPQG